MSTGRPNRLVERLLMGVVVAGAAGAAVVLWWATSTTRYPSGTYQSVSESPTFSVNPRRDDSVQKDNGPSSPRIRSAVAKLPFEIQLATVPFHRLNSQWIATSIPVTHLPWKHGNALSTADHPKGVVSTASLPFQNTDKTAEQPVNANPANETLPSARTTNAGNVAVAKLPWRPLASVSPPRSTNDERSVWVEPASYPQEWNKPAIVLDAKHPRYAYVPVASMDWADPQYDRQHQLPTLLPCAAVPWTYDVRSPEPVVLAIATLQPTDQQHELASFAKRGFPIGKVITSRIRFVDVLNVNDGRIRERLQTQANAYLQQAAIARARSLARTATEIASNDAFAKATRAQTALPKFVMAMCRDLQGNLWVGAEDDEEGNGGVWRYDVGKEWWTHFTVKDGLGDNNGYAIACDQLGRIWVGHLNHGVSVFNGNAKEHWQCYEILSELSNPNTLSGPLGERVFSIAIAPASGDVWIGTNNGLTRYQTQSRQWNYYTTAEGLPSNEVEAITFGPDDTIFCASSCDGIATSSAKHGYTKWSIVSCTDKERGLKTNLINNIFMARDTTLYAATIYGFAFSTDKGQSWHFIEGEDNPAVFAKARVTQRSTYSGVTRCDTIPCGYVTCIADAADNDSVWVGTRKGVWKFSQRLQTFDPFHGGDGKFISTIIPGVKDSLNIGTYGTGLLGSPTLSGNVNPAVVASLPTTAISSTSLHSISALVNTFQPEDNSRCFYLGQDWATQGDWVGHYGQNVSVLCAANSPLDHVIAMDDVFDITPTLGYAAAEGDGVRHWISQPSTNDRRILWDPYVGHRRDAQWDDHGESYGLTQKGPDIDIHFHLPEGQYRVTLYFVNGQSSTDCLRDFEIDLFRDDAGADPNALSALAHARVHNFHGGVYSTFILHGSGNYAFRVAKNGSLNTTCNAVFVDSYLPSKRYPGLQSRAMMGDVDYDPPVVNPSSLAEGIFESESPLFKAMNSPLGMFGANDKAQRLQVLRLVDVDAATGAKFAGWRWSLGLWKGADRALFDDVTGRAWEGYLKKNPTIRVKIAQGLLN